MRAGNVFRNILLHSLYHILAYLTVPVPVTASLSAATQAE